jgi:hypothetical protein
MIYPFIRGGGSALNSTTTTSNRDAETSIEIARSCAGRED